MRLQMHPKTKTIQITDDTRDYLEKKLDKMSKRFRKEPEAQFTQNFEHGLHIVEVTLNGDGLLLRSQERHSNLRAAIDRVVDKLDSQWKRFKEKRTDGHRQPSPLRDGAAIEAAVEAEFAAHIVRRKNFTLESLSPEEAARQMELLGHSFFVFQDEKTERIAVLYKREGGDYGLIETEKLSSR